MKYFVVLTLILLSAASFGQSNRQRLEDLEDKLDMMQAEQEYRDAIRMRDQSNAYGSSSPTETPLQTRLRIGQYSRIFRNDNVSIYIQDSSLENMGTNIKPVIKYQFIYDFTKPQYIANKTFFIIEGSAKMFCGHKQVVYGILTHAFDKKLNTVARLNWGLSNTENTLADHERKYLCR
jgi:hypothetical protein